jgi:hypothetical protein
MSTASMIIVIRGCWASDDGMHRGRHRTRDGHGLREGGFQPSAEFIDAAEAHVSSGIDATDAEERRRTKSGTWRDRDAGSRRKQEIAKRTHALEHRRGNTLLPQADTSAILQGKAQLEVARAMSPVEA